MIFYRTHKVSTSDRTCNNLRDGLIAPKGGSVNNRFGGNSGAIQGAEESISARDSRPFSVMS
ncbi:hypothetical protein SAMN04515618_11293 [Collimonas sp. OK307]|nr:hypothetical protein SAMN04515618_11293 [Collimonas sp. OK307]